MEHCENVVSQTNFLLVFVPSDNFFLSAQTIFLSLHFRDGGQAQASSSVHRIPERVREAQVKAEKPRNDDALSHLIQCRLEREHFD